MAADKQQITGTALPKKTDADAEGREREQTGASSATGMLFLGC
jgi:hypothetical protein